MELKIDPDSFSHDGTDLTIQIDFDDLINAILEKKTIGEIIHETELHSYDFIEKAYEELSEDDQDLFIGGVKDFLSDYSD